MSLPIFSRALMSVLSTPATTIIFFLRFCFIDIFVTIRSALSTLQAENAVAVDIFTC